MADFPPLHPGELLSEDFMKPLGLSQRALAAAIKVPPRRINEIVLGKRSITPDTARRLGRYFGNDPRIWMDIQTRYDMEMLELEKGAQIDREVSPRLAVGQ